MFYRNKVLCHFMKARQIVYSYYPENGVRNSEIFTIYEYSKAKQKNPTVKYTNRFLIGARFLVDKSFASRKKATKNTHTS